LAEVRQETLREQAVLTGSTVPWRRAELSVRVDGLVTDLLVDEGSRVVAGDPILALDARLAEHDVAAAEARLREAEARHKDAIRVKDELLRLKRGRHASETEIESAIAEVDIAAAALSGERAATARARELVERHRLRAPFSGMIVAKNVEVGEWAKRDEAAVVLVALDRLRVRAVVPQRDYARIDAGARSRVRFDAFPDRPFDGAVRARIALGDERSRTFPLLIDLPNPGGLLAPGMSARVEVELAGDRREALTVPRDAVVAKTDGSRAVWRVRQEDGQLKVDPIPVEIGRASGARLEILNSPLAAGDRVVLLGNEGLRPGQVVEPKNAAPTTAAAATP
jgi:RND family efflux transporter MFP subunit